MKEGIEDTEWYRGNDLMNIQKKLLYQSLIDEIKAQGGEMAYFLDIKEKNSQNYNILQKDKEAIQARSPEADWVGVVKSRQNILDRAQSDILKILQPLFDQVFDSVAKKIPPGKEYNKELKQDLWFDLIFGEREITGATEGSRDTYRLESVYRGSEERFQKKIAKREEARKKAKEKVRLPLGHKLISNENYLSMVAILIKNIETYIPRYMQRLEISSPNEGSEKKFFQKYIMYLCIRALIEEKMVFDMKSTKAKRCLDGTIEELFSYFGEKYGVFPMTLVDFKRKLRHNHKSDTDPMDLSYMNAILEDIEYRERYLNTTYFLPQNITINDLRREIMEEYNSGVGLIEKSFELLNPRYHIYKDDIEKHIKHLNILKTHQKNTTETDPHIATIIQEIEEKLRFAQEKKKEHTKLEEKYTGIRGKPQYSITQVQQKHLKRYKVPIQYRHIFGIVINKLNNFYQIKSNIAKKSDKINQELLERLIHSDREGQHFSYYLHNYMTFARMDEIFDKEWSEKRKHRNLEIKNKCLYGEKIKKQKVIKEVKKGKRIIDGQLSLDL